MKPTTREMLNIIEQDELPCADTIADNTDKHLGQPSALAEDMTENDTVLGELLVEDRVARGMLGR